MITFDFETKSYADLKKVGSWVYSEHPTTEIICAAYGIEDEPVQSWWPGKKLTGVQSWEENDPNARGPFIKHMPYDLACALGKEMPIEAHNVAFERGIWHNICIPEFGWGEVRP